MANDDGAETAATIGIRAAKALYNLERDATAYQEYVFFQGPDSIKKSIADRFVESVVAANILSQTDQLPILVKQTGRM